MRKETGSGEGRHGAARWLGALLAALLLFSGCAKTPIIIPPNEQPQTARPASPATPSAPAQPRQRLADTMRRAFNDGGYEEASRLARQVLDQADATRQEKLDAWRCLAFSQASLDDWRAALDALDGWKALAPDAGGSWEWANLWGTCVGHLPEAELRSRAAAMLYDNRQEAVARSRAAMLLLTHMAPDSDVSVLLGIMSAIYAAVPQTDQAQMEKALAHDLRSMNPQTLSSLARALQSAADAGSLPQSATYPYALILIEQARRLSRSDDVLTSAPATATLARLCSSAALATDKRILPRLGDLSDGLALPKFHVASAPTPDAATPFAAPADSTVALLLPMSGHYRAIAGRIARGAEIARASLAEAGMHLKVAVIDTDQADWQARLAALPRGVVVGGPVRPGIVEQLRKSGAAEGRAIFTFTTRLGDGEEGARLWRFFPGLGDQVEALLNFVSDGMGVSAVASLYPEDAYGRRMTELFTRAAEDRYHLRASSLSYPPREGEKWNALAASLLGVRKTTPPMRPHPSFQALFLPDSWLGAQTMVSHLFFHQETRLILMGTTLWEQSLWELMRQKKPVPDANAFSLAVFPGAWNPQTTEPAGEYLRQAAGGAQEAGFWAALGYDFIRFAARLGGPADAAGSQGGWSAAEVNSRLGQAAAMQWALAPMRWSASGAASEALYVFTPTAGGYRLARPDEFRAAVEKARQAFDRRWRSQ